MPTSLIQGLASRGGLSNWLLFLREKDVVLCDLGVAPALAHGAAAGIGVMTSPAGFPTPSDHLDSWCEEVCRTSKAVETLEDAHVTRVVLRQSFLPHQLHIETKDGTQRKFGFLDRPYSAGVAEPLRERFGEKLDLVTTGPFAFLSRYAPFMLK